VSEEGRTGGEEREIHRDTEKAKGKEKGKEEEERERYREGERKEGERGRERERKLCLFVYLFHRWPACWAVPDLAACHLIYVFSVVLHCISIHVVTNKVLSLLPRLVVVYSLFPWQLMTNRHCTFCTYISGARSSTD